MTTRRWMVAVAVVAAAFAVCVMVRSREKYLDLAWEMQNLVEQCTADIVIYSGTPRGPGYHTPIPKGFDPMAAPLPAEMEWLRRRYVHFSRMRQKYEFAAAHPWLPVEPDPPLPD
jgi:hypothetical protein